MAAVRPPYMMGEFNTGLVVNHTPAATLLRMVRRRPQGDALPAATALLAPPATAAQQRSPSTPALPALPTPARSCLCPPAPQYDALGYRIHLETFLGPVMDPLRFDELAETEFGTDRNIGLVRRHAGCPCA